MANLQEPSEQDSIDCHLQNIGMGTLLCRAARQTGDGKSTDEVTPTICYNCEAGKIFREVGCNAVTPKIRILMFASEPHTPMVEGLFCSIRKRYTDLEYCGTCGLATAETTRHVISTARGLFENFGFHSAYQNIEKARESMRDGNFENTITRGISCLESTMRICHERLRQSLPSKKQVSDLWKSTREILKFDKLDPENSKKLYMACYDLDEFKKYLFETRFFDVHGVERGVIERLGEGEGELLSFAHKWVRFNLFGEDTLKLKDKLFNDILQAKYR